jgi:hypothetical protein
MAETVLDDEFELELDLELSLLRDAVVLVASGAARRVVVANLRHGRVIAEPARALAGDCGVELTLLETADPRRVDFAVARFVTRARALAPVELARIRIVPDASAV